MRNSKKTSIIRENAYQNLLESQKEIVLCLIHLTPPILIDTLISLCKVSPAEILNFMESLKKKKLVFEKKEFGKGRYFLNNIELEEVFQGHLTGEKRSDMLKRIIDFYHHFPEKGQETTLRLGDLYMKAGITGKGLSYIKKAADILYRSGQIEKATPYYNCIIQEFSERIPEKEEAVAYLDSVFRPGSIYTFYAIDFHFALTLLERAYGVAKQYNHPYYQAKISLFLGYRLQEIGHFRKASQYINNFWRLDKKLNDEGLRRTGVLLKSGSMLLKGDLSKAIDYYENMTGGLEKFGDTEEDLLASLMVATNHVCCGRIARGLGMIEAVRSKATQTLHLREAAGLAEFAMLLALIEIRDAPKARLCLERVQKAFPENVLPRINAGMYYNCKAYILCTTQDYVEALKYLKMAYAHATSAGSTSHSRSFLPWVLECLYLIESKGFVDEDLNLDSQIEGVLLSWDNPYMKGAALRYRALRNIKRRQSKKIVLSDLKLSEKYLNRAGANIELARTRIDLGNYCLSKGRTVQGRSYLEKARVFLSGIDKDLFPKDLLEMIPWEQKVDIIIDRITEINRSFVKARDVPSFLERAINAAMDFTMATRGAIFSLKEGKLEIVASRNVVPSLFAGDIINEFEEIIIQAIKKDKELLIPKGDAGDQQFFRLGITSFIGMPVKIGDHPYGYLVLDSRLKKTLFSEHSIPFVRMLASQTALGLLTISSYEEVRELKERFEDEAIFYKREMGVKAPLTTIVGQSKGIRKVIDQVRQVASTDTTVLILGETGVGKELVAKAIHNLSDRKEGPFIPVNLAALPQELVASELFGHEKGSFTGAHERQKGRFELADGGTIFLDEIGDLPLNVQVKLLRVLQEGTFERLGSAKPIRSDFRVIAATHKNLPAEVGNGVFRQDLYYRLKVFPIQVPPLRERLGDIGPLAQHFIEIFAKKLGKKAPKLLSDELKKLASYNWPGNVRELEHVVERSVILSDGSKIRFSGLETSFAKRVEDEAPLIIPLVDIERDHIKRALEATGWRVSGPKGAATFLGLKRSTLQNRMKKLGIKKPSVSTT